jgi:hypothetical protein
MTITMTQPSEVVKRSISLSRVVSDWAESLADAKGFGTNFSAYIADLIRRDKEREDQLKLTSQGSESSSLKAIAEAEIEEAVQQAIQKHRSPKRK